jgi:YHS domain-containing protein
MRRIIPSLFIIAAVLFTVAGPVSSETGKDTVVCPVCGYIMAKEDASTYEHDGKTYYFCEPGCKAYFISNTEMMTSGKGYDPVCGMVVGKVKAVTAEHNGFMNYFCSESCRDKYLADPTQYEINYDVVAGEMKPVREMKHTLEFEGRTLYFISEENKKKFEANPDSYVWAECGKGGSVFLRKDAYAKREYKGKTYYFGCKGCLEAFEKDPAGYLEKAHTGGHTCSHTGAKQAEEGCMSGKKGDSHKCPHAQEGCKQLKKEQQPMSKKS